MHYFDFIGLIYTSIFVHHILVQVAFIELFTYILEMIVLYLWDLQNKICYIDMYFKAI